MPPKIVITIIVASVAVLIANASPDLGVIQEQEIPAGETFTFVSDEGYRKVVTCSFEYKHDCNWLCLPFWILDEEGAILPNEGTFSVSAEEENITIKNQHKSEIFCVSRAGLINPPDNTTSGTP